MKRYLGAAERSFWIFDQFSRTGGISVVHIDGVLEEQRLKLALRRLQRRHPLTRVRVAEDNKGPYFTEKNVPDIPLEVLTPDTSRPINAHVDNLKREDIRTEFDVKNAPFLRIKLIKHPTEQRHYLMVSASHLLVDAHALLNLGKDILKYYEASNPNIESLPLRPPLESLFPASFTGWKGALRSVGQQFRILRQRVLTQPIRFTEDIYVDFKVRKNNFQKVEIGSESAEKIIAHCKGKGVTVHGFLSAVVMKAIYQEYQSNLSSDYNRKSHVSLASAVNFREQLEPPCIQDAGSYVCMNPGFFHVKDRDLWQIAKNVSEDVRKRYTQKEHFTALNAGQWITPKTLINVENTLRMAEKQGPGNLTISNYGRSDFPSNIGSIRILEVDFISAISVLGNLLVSVAYILGTLHWHFIYPDKMISDARVKNLIDSCKNSIALATNEASKSDRIRSAVVPTMTL